jgi:hypothetical protein
MKNFHIVNKIVDENTKLVVFFFEIRDYFHSKILGEAKIVIEVSDCLRMCDTEVGGSEAVEQLTMRIISNLSCCLAFNHFVVAVFSSPFFPPVAPVVIHIEALQASH